MKKTILLSVSALLSMMVSAQTVECMDSLKPEQKAMAVSLKLTGRLSASANGDYRQMRDLCFQAISVMHKAPKYPRMHSIRDINS